MTVRARKKPPCCVILRSAHTRQISPSSTENGTHCYPSYAMVRKHRKPVPTSGIAVKGPGLADLASLPNLKGLCIVGENAITWVKYLRALPKLSFLVIGGWQVNDITSQPLAELKSLEELYLEGTAVSESGVAKLKALLPNCKISSVKGDSTIEMNARANIIDKEEAARRAWKDTPKREQGPEPASAAKSGTRE